MGYLDLAAGDECYAVLNISDKIQKFEESVSGDLPRFLGFIGTFHEFYRRRPPNIDLAAAAPIPAAVTMVGLTGLATSPTA